MKLAHCKWTIVLAGACALALGATASTRQSSGEAQDAQSAIAQNAKSQTPQGQASSQQTDALAAAARRAREKQKEQQAKPAKVWDNDNIPTAGGLNVVGSSAQNSAAQNAPATSGGPSAENAGQPAANGAEPAQKPSKADLEAQLKSARDDLANLSTQLDFAQRKLGLDQQDFYRNPDYSSDAAGARNLKNDQSQIDALKQQVADAQKKVDDLAAKVQAAGQDKSSSGSQGSGANQ